MKKILSLLLIVTLTFTVSCKKEAERTVPFEHFRTVKRQLLLAENKNAGEYLTSREGRVNDIVQKYISDFRDKHPDGTTPFLQLKPEIEKSPLFALIRKMPKGANLHLHAPMAAPVEKLYDLAARTKNLYVYLPKGKDKNEREQGKELGKLAVFNPKHVPDGFVPFHQAAKKDLPKKELLKLLQIHRGGEKAWGRLRSAHARVVPFINSEPEIYKAFLTAAFQDAVDDNIDHLELRMRFRPFGNKRYQNVTQEQALKDAYLAFKRKHPDFSLKIIYTMSKKRHSRGNMILTEYYNMLDLKKRIKDDFDPENPVDLIVGTDMAGQEDAAWQFSRMTADFEVLYNQGYLRDLYLHAGESSRQNSYNVVDAYLLKSNRIGHGTNLYRFPELANKFAEEQIPLEIAPVSNHSLGYVKDWRDHPAIEYVRRGIPVVIGSDDPLLFGNNGLSYDFFIAAVYWDMSLAELKKFCVNSIKYSAVTDPEREEMMNRWAQRWDDFIDDVLQD